MERRPDDSVTRFYFENVEGLKLDHGAYTATCPFCRAHGVDPPGKLVVLLNPRSFFHGYFRCLSRCVHGGFPLWFSAAAGLDPATVPGFDKDPDPAVSLPDYPVVNLNGEARSFHERLSEGLLEQFNQSTIPASVLKQMLIGFNGRYITYPYVQADGNCYSMRCVHPEQSDDYFWHGEEKFSSEPFQVFNVQEIQRCSGGALFLCEGEENLLVLKQLGYPGIGVPFWNSFETLESACFEKIKTLFLITRKSAEAETAAREFAARVGYKVRLLCWSSGTARQYSLCDLAREQGRATSQAVSRMIRESNAFSPFTSPEIEYSRCLNRLHGRSRQSYISLRTGFDRLDAALDGLHGINIIGGAPKVGKSAFVIQAASQMAERGIPVLYYDFENGRQQVYQRILSRMSRLSVGCMANGDLSVQEQETFDGGKKRFKKMLETFRVVNDRKVTPELMRKHIDFIRHETRNEYTVVVIDSLHKLPFKNLAERRTGIDAWLRQLEVLRDEMQVSFLVISELSRGDDKPYGDEPHLGIFKGSGDIEYSADNAIVLYEHAGDSVSATGPERLMRLWIVASREHSPGLVADYILDYPYWGFIEQ